MGEFQHLPSGIIKIDGHEFDIETFLAIEPDYSLPEGAISRVYNSNSHHRIFSKNTQYSGDFPWEDGERYINRVFDLKLYEDELKEDTKYVEEVRKTVELANQTIKKPDKYSNKTKEMIIAMWEHIINEKDYDESGISDLIKKIKMEKY